MSILVFSGNSSGNLLKEVYATARHLTLNDIIIVTNEPQPPELQTKIIQHFQEVEIAIHFQTCEFEQLDVEIFDLAKTIATSLADVENIIIDCNSGKHFNSHIIRTAAEMVADLNHVLFASKIDVFEALRAYERAPIHFVPLNRLKFSPQILKVLLELEEGLSEVEIAENIGTTQSSVNAHLKQLRKMGLIEGKRKKMRKRSPTGDLLAEIIHLMEKLPISS